MSSTAARLELVIACMLGLVPGLAVAQADCGFPVFYPAGATCSGGTADGRPCYVYDAGDNFGCPGGTCIPSPGGGRATYYEAATGACGIPVTDPQAMVTAVAEYLWEDSAVCGRCARVTGPEGTVVVEITDQCPADPNPQWCAGDAAHLDLSEAAFAAVADPPRGVTYVEWEIIECPVAGNANLLNKDGINPWWYAVFALDIRQGVTGLEVKDSSAGAVWLPGVRQSYNAFVVSPGYEMILPYSVRLTGITGQALTGTDVVTDLIDFSEFDLGDQFDHCSLFSDGFESGDTSEWSATVP
jgi:expansin (peptidoglycan-binding protein)